jgi:hypothetical protein
MVGMSDTAVAYYENKQEKKSLKRWWMVPIIILVLFCIIATPAYAVVVITGFNLNQVGETVYSWMTVGSGNYTYFAVGGYSYSTNEGTNSLAQTILPVLAVIFVVFYALRSLAQTNGFYGFIQTAMIFVIGSIVLGAVVMILSQLT